MSLEKQMIFGKQLDFGQTLNLSQWLINSALQHADKIAVSNGKEELTFKELHERSNQVANFLLKNFKAPSIGICEENTIARLIILLGIVKAGKAYVPLDPSYPKSRLEYIAKDANLSWIISGEQYEKLFCNLNSVKLMVVNGVLKKTVGLSKNIPEVSIDPLDPVHILYTSGSTGKPKGVIGSHRAIVNRFRWTHDEFPLNEAEVCCQKTVLNFIPSVWETFGPLVFGIKLILIESRDVKDVRLFIEKLKQNKITRIILVPSLLEAILQQLHVTQEKLDNLKLWMTSGERLSRQLVQQFYAVFPDAELVNIYGSTEIEDGCYFRTKFSHYGLFEEMYVPIGYPIANSVIAILDENGKVLPNGGVGEICFYGPGVARGYKNLASFSDKLAKVDDRKFFRTGDCGRLLENNAIEYLGRNDHMLKIRGQRVELGEIEAEVNVIKGIKKAVVTCTDQRDFLICFYVSDEGSNIVGEIIRNILLEKLPDFMVPVRYLSMSSIPLTPNGKVDRLALPSIDIFNRPINALPVLPQSKLEKAIAEIFKEILRLNEIGINDNFVELGGDSLKAASLLTTIQQKFDVVIGFQQFFRDATVAQLRKIIEKSPAKKSPYPHLKGDEGSISLSPLQKRLWLQQEFLGEQLSVFNLSSSFEIIGNIDTSLLLDALEMVIANQTIFSKKLIVNQEQVVLDKTDLAPITLQYFPTKVAANTFLDLYASKPLDIHAILSNFCLLKIGENSTHHLIACKIHHIIFDGYSLSLFSKELMQTIRAKLIERTPHLDTPFKFYNAFNQQDEYLPKDKLKNFWGSYLNGYSGFLAIPTDYVRDRTEMIPKGHRVSMVLPAEIESQIDVLARQLKITPYAIYFAAYFLLLARYSQQKDIVIGIPMALRDNPFLERAIGFFVNTIPMRVRMDKKISIVDLLKQIAEDALKVHDHRSLPFDQILETSNISREMGVHPIYQVMFAMQSYDMALAINKDIQVTWQELDNGSTEVDLTLTIQPLQKSRSREIVAEYNRGLFKQTTIERFLGHYINILKSIVTDNKQYVEKIDFLDEAEKQTLLTLHNQTAVNYPQAVSLYDLFERHVLSTPNKVAVEYDDKKLTYQDVSCRVSALANKLTDAGVRHQNYICLSIRRSEQLIIAMLAIWKLGAIYLPIDPELPQERIHYILEDTGAEYALVETDTGNLYQNTSVKLININTENLDERSEKKSTSDDIAYVMYTSGSTGTPKGVVISQKSIVHRMFCLLDFYRVDMSCRHLQYGSYSFDTALEELLLPVFSGGTLIFAPRQLTYDPQEFIDLIQTYQITTLNFIPSLHRIFLDYIELNGLKGTESLKFVISGAERLTPDIVQKFYRYFPDKVLFNSYGPTENTINSALHVCTIEDGLARSVPIGKTLANSTCYVFDEQLQLVPFGVPGELWVGGIGLAVEYLHRSDLTQEKFIENPHVKGERLYCTGDKVCMHEDGVIEFIGRNDNQVKIRGYRVELGEIEAKIRGSNLVKHAVVINKTDKHNEMYLVAYVTADISRYDIQKLLRQYLKNTLPYYMMPRAFILLDEFPLLTSGKINLQALPEPSIDDSSETKESASKSPLEQKLFDIWVELLGIKAFNIDDNFFYLGGSSIQATRLVIEIKNRLGKNIRLKDFFKKMTIRGLVELVEVTEKFHEVNAITKKLIESEKIPLSFSQERMWFIDKFNGDNTENILPLIITLKGALNIERLQHAIVELCFRHAVLKTNFAEAGGAPFQFIQQNYKTDIEIIEGRNIDEIVTQELQRTFNLEKDALIRFRLVKESTDYYILVVVMHHIIGDGWSSALLLEEVADLYNGTDSKLPSSSIDYFDYAYAEKEQAKDYQIPAYWYRRLAGELPLLQLPIDFQRPAKQTFSGGAVTVHMDEQHLQILKKFGSEQSVSMFSLFISAYFTLLHIYTRQSDLMVGTVFSNRTNPDYEKMIGFFANTLPLRAILKDETTFIELVQYNQQQLLDVTEYQSTPFSKLVETFVKERDISRSALFQTLFVMQDTVPEKAKFDNVEIHYSKAPHLRSKFDLSVLVSEHSNGMDFTFEYNTDLFLEETIARMANGYLSLLMACITQNDVPISHIDYLPENERALLRQFNQTESLFKENNLTLDELCLKSFQQYSDKVAIINDTVRLTFKEVDHFSSQLAHKLVFSKVHNNKLVAVVMEKGWEQVIAILAVLKAGAAYLPINIHDPIDRIEEVLGLGKVKIILSQSRFHEKLLMLEKYQNIPVDHCQNYEAYSTQSPEIIRNSDALAYVIFTSGSTGNPKGVMIKHAAAVNTILDINQRFHVGSQDVIYGISALNFDLSVYDIFGSLSTGATLVLPKEDERKEPAKWLEHIHRHGVSFWNSVPALLQMLVDYLSVNSEKKQIKSIKNILLSGDWIPLDLPANIKKYINNDTQLTSLGGATEASIWSICYQVDQVQERWRSIPYGQPMLNQKFYVLNEHLKELPIGAPGELYIGGVSVADGYWADADRTEKAFKLHPITGERIYKTGDMGRYFSDGNIEFLGRNDHQVKIRGYRVELGEVQSKIAEIKNIEKVIVLDHRSQQGDVYLVAYIVISPEYHFQEAVVKKILKEKLPEYMIPNHFIPIASIPLTANGKIDRAVLPQVNYAMKSMEYISPLMGLETEIATVWKKVLLLTSISRSSNFFEIGGHSLLAAKIIFELEEIYFVDISVNLIFASPVLADFATDIDILIRHKKMTHQDNAEIIEEGEF